MNCRRLNSTEVKHTLNQIGYNRVFVVIFIKVDGTQRQMRCMMENPVMNSLAAYYENGSKNPDVVPVKDLDKGAWRSFRLDSVLSIST